MIDVKAFRKKYNITQKTICDILGIKQPYLSAIESGKRPLSKEKFELLYNQYGNILIEFRQLEPMLPFNTAPEEMESPLPASELKPKEYSTHLEVKLVTTRARAGYSESYYADEYLEDMPTLLIEADREYHGKYLAFEVDGDSMEPEYHPGDVVICREIKRDLWRYKLHFEDWDFVIAHGTQGIMLKQIMGHNVETGDIVCHSVNSELHPDFTLNLREVAFLYNVVEHRISGKSKRRYR